jgi:hypothetical protein
VDEGPKHIRLVSVIFPRALIQQIFDLVRVHSVIKLFPNTIHPGELSCISRHAGEEERMRDNEEYDTEDHNTSKECFHVFAILDDGE